MTDKYNEEEIRKNYNRLTKLLIRKNLTITTMESLTSGQIASLITDTEGASAIFRGADITYCNDTKIRRGVPAEILNSFSVYSEETALAMAKACKREYKSDIGIGVTGTAGNLDPQNRESSVPGEVYFGIETDDCSKAFHVKLEALPSRYMYKLAVAREVYDALIDILTEDDGLS